MTLRHCEKHLVHLRTHLGSYWGSFCLLLRVSLADIIPGTAKTFFPFYCLKYINFFSFLLSQMQKLFFLSIVSKTKTFFPFHCLKIKNFFSFLLSQIQKLFFLSIFSNTKTFYPFYCLKFKNFFSFLFS